MRRFLLKLLVLATFVAGFVTYQTVEPATAEHTDYESWTYIGFTQCGGYHFNLASAGTGDFYGAPPHHQVSATYNKQNCPQDIGVKVCAYDQGAFICADDYAAEGQGHEAWARVQGHCSYNWCNTNNSPRDEFDYLNSTYRMKKNSVCEWWNHDPWNGYTYGGSTGDTSSLACPWAYAWTSEPDVASDGHQSDPHYV